MLPGGFFMKQMKHLNATQKLAVSGLLIAVGTIASSVVVIPVGVSRCYPVQHLLNVMAAVLLGPGYAVLNAFLISLLRNMLGLGSILAFPGSMIGALLAGLAYKWLKKPIAAAVGEVIGTGLIGGLVAFPMAKWLLGSQAAAFFFIPAFSLSSAVGAILGVIILKVIHSGE
jgi:energy coupling factor transporter S component ThiW